MHGQTLSNDARQIWQAGVDAVNSERLVRECLGCDDERLTICGHTFVSSELKRIAVVGAGKAGAGMARGVEQSLSEPFLAKLEGWVNVPEDCLQTLARIHLHAARPAGVNEPTEAGVAGAQRILNLVRSLDAHDLCIVLISGGGSALLPAPAAPLTLQDKQQVTRFLMHAGASIGQLNTVRKRLSAIKGGGLARACRAGKLLGLVISDIVGDPLEMIASGPTCPDSTTDQDALQVLRQFSARPPAVPSSVLDLLAKRIDQPVPAEPFPASTTENHIIGNNGTALHAAIEKAKSLGYDVESLGSNNTGDADEEGRGLAERCLARREAGLTRPLCFVSGGEPVVHLAKTDQPRKGGRNQQLVLAALERLWDEDARGIAILAGGTDGEDGPTDAAGGWVDEAVHQRARQANRSPTPDRAINNAYPYLKAVGGLLITGPTHTNVMDLRVALIAP